MQGLAEGPCSEEKINEIIGDKFWVAGRRFGILQKEKIRQNDDFSEYSLDACTTVAHKITVAGVDAIADFAKSLADKSAHAKKHPRHGIEAKLSTGEIAKDRVHDDYLIQSVKLVRKCIDIGPAYKQCPASPAHSRYSIFALKNPDAPNVELFFASALLSGATEASHVFSRAAMAFDYLTHEYAGVVAPTTSIPSPSASPKSRVRRNTRKFFKEPGREAKRETVKPASQSRTALGVEVDFSDTLGTVDPQIQVRNKPGRIHEICEKTNWHLSIQK